jgi:hypothetical protein
MGKADTQSAIRNNRNISWPFSQEVYNANINNPLNFRKCPENASMNALNYSQNCFQLKLIKDF